jgi:hypothetical protein
VGSRRKGEGERKKIVRPPQLCTTKEREEGKKEGRRKEEEGRKRKEKRGRESTYCLGMKLLATGGSIKFVLTTFFF